MSRITHRVLRAAALAVLLALAAVVRVDAGSDRSKWWMTESTRAELGLTDDQSRALEAVFQSMLPRMRAEKATLDREDAALSRLMLDGADERELALAIERVEAARSAASKTRTWMLVRMYRILSPVQRVQLQAIHERQQRAHRDRSACESSTRP